MAKHAITNYFENFIAYKCFLKQINMKFTLINGENMLPTNNFVSVYEKRACTNMQEIRAAVDRHQTNVRRQRYGSNRKK